MVFRPWQIRVAGIIVALGSAIGSAASQDVHRRSTPTIVQDQMDSIAEEVVGKLQLVVNSVVTVSVVPATTSGLAENAFVKALQQQGHRAFVRPQQDSSGIDVNIGVVESGAQFREIGTAAYERVVRTALEVRTEKNNGEAIAVLGMVQRVYADTVSVKDAEIAFPRKGMNGDEDATFFERLVTPLIVLASGIMIVYLFFTVRS